MTERPIIFSGEMVRAILDGRKTQTRRVVKPQFPRDWAPATVGWYFPTCVASDGEEYPGDPVYGAADEECGRRCPYGTPGDLLWVREAWAVMLPNAREWPVDTQRECTIYRATHLRSDECRWRPSIHMPRWASRITLEITSVDVQRVQDITDDDAIAEGIHGGGAQWSTCGAAEARYKSTPRKAFIYLWDHINAKRGFGWDANPWVWVIGFRRIAE